ncbi:tail fiber domain-containing protein, partial [Daejeonella sp. H1SJ63]|uniref:tail fiber domain-containing protein n=1 Tax=Daejeonella sp. H1SJ63 TaxID=3034145 RepID=UPI0023EDB794
GTGGTLGSNAYTSTAFAPLASPTFTGTVTLPTGTVAVTQAANNNSTALATTAYADAAALTAKFADGTAIGNTPYWNGTAWVVSSSNIYNAGTNVGIGMTPSGTYKFEVNGKVKSTGINETSDIRWKKDITTVEGALAKVMAMRGVNYNWRKDEFPDKNFESDRQLGLIAQEVETIVPEVVRTDDKGFKTVEYSKLVSLLLEAIKDQQKLISKQESDISALKSEVGKAEIMQAEINEIKAILKSMDTQAKPVIANNR